MVNALKPQENLPTQAETPETRQMRRKRQREENKLRTKIQIKKSKKRRFA